MKTEVKEISPAYAAELLKNNRKNRPLRKNRISFLRQQMERGMWKVTHQGICIDKEGNISDGQHRLHAIIDYGKPIALNFTTGVDPDIFDVIDTGVNRNSSDVLAIEGYKNYSLLAGALRFIFLFKKALYGSATAGGGGERLYLTNSDILQLAEDNLHYEVWVQNARNYHLKFRLFGTRITCGMYILLMEKDADLTQIFYDKTYNGLELQNGDVIGMLRQKFIDNEITLRKLTSRTKLALFIKSWNYFKMNKNPKVLKYVDGTDEFPQII